MRIAVQADNGDEVSICADFVSVEQAVVTLEIENRLYNDASELDSVTLSIDKARELAKALMCVSASIEYVRLPLTSIDRAVEAIADVPEGARSNGTLASQESAFSRPGATPVS